MSQASTEMQPDEIGVFSLSQFTIYVSSEFSKDQIGDEIKFTNSINILDQIESYKKEKEIIIGIIDIEGDPSVYIFVFHTDIFLIGQNDFQNLKQFINENKDQVYFLNLRYDNDEKSEEKPNQKKIIQNSSIIKCIIKKNIIRIQNSQIESNTNEIQKNTESNTNEIQKDTKFNLDKIVFNNDQLTFILEQFETNQSFDPIDSFFRSSCIQNYYGYIKDDKNIYAVFNHKHEINDDELLDNIIKNKNLEDEKKMEIILTIMKAIEYLHSYYFLFKDLDIKNIIIDHEQKVKFIGFDLIMPVDEKEMEGDICYSSFKTDIYSLGRIIHFIITKEKIENNAFYIPNCPKDYEVFFKIYKYCFESKREERPSIKQIINDTIFFCSQKYGNSKFLNEINNSHADIMNDIFLKKFTYDDSLIFINDSIDEDTIYHLIELYDYNTGIMIGDFKIDENLDLIIFIFDSKIILIDQNQIKKTKKFWDDIYNKVHLFYLNEKCKNIIDDIQESNDLSNENEQTNEDSSSKSTQKKNDLIDEKLKKEILQKVKKTVINCIIIKSKLRTKNRHLNAIPIIYDFNYDNFFLYKHFSSTKSLQLNSDDQYLYIIKRYDKEDKISCQLHDHLFSFFKYNNNNPFISKFYGQIQNNQSNILVFEYLENDSLKEFINKIEKKEEEMRFIIQIMCVIEIFHFNNFVFQNLSLNSFVVDSNRNVIFTDFDSIKPVDELETNSSQNVQGKFTQDLILFLGENFEQKIKNLGLSKISEILNQEYSKFEKNCNNQKFLKEITNIRKNTFESLVKSSIINEDISDLYSFLNYPEIA